MLAMVLSTLFLTVTFYLGYQVALDSKRMKRNNDYIQTWFSDLGRKGDELEQVKQRSDEQLRTLAVRMAELQARLIRLDALGELVAKSADFDATEFDFSSQPAVGGPELVNEADSQAYKPPDFMQAIDQLARDIEARERNLEVLNTLLGNKDFEADRYISGRPIKWGWMSSPFGRRTDPFNGRLAWHSGVDFAGKENSDVVSVAAGVVTWAGPRYGYGNMVEVNHGGEYSTRYAHANEVLVKVGDLVEKGQTVASMGSTGRSTGPHVHFEVLRDGKPINPYKYVQRTSQ